jgi:subtilase family serine protease
VQGIGLPVVDNGDAFGSPNRLQGFIDMGPVSQYRQAPFGTERGTAGLQTTLGVLAHELGHRWLASVRFDDQGQPSKALLGKDDAHWSFLLSSEASFLYGNEWQDFGGGLFRSVAVQSRYSELDLYLMGLLAPEDVSPLSLLVSPDADGTRLPQLAAEVTAERVETITLDRVLAVEGARMPSHESSQKDFNVAFVFLSGPNLIPTERDLEAVGQVRNGFVDTFFGLTRGRALVDPDLQHVPRVNLGQLPDIALATDWLLGQQKPDGRFEAHPESAVRDTATVATALSTLGRGGAALQDARAYLALATPNAVDGLSRSLQAGASISVSALEAHRNDDGGFGIVRGYKSDPLDTALALAALTAAGAGESTRTGIATALQSMQEGDGSFSSIAGQPGDVLTTSETARALALAGVGGADSDEAIQNALAWLVQRQQQDGGLGDGPSTPYATALGLEALLLGTVPPTSVDRALAYLGQTQRPDGSWGGSVFETGAVLRALLPATFANLSIGPADVALSPDPPEVGETLSVEVTIRNRSLISAGPFDVQLFDGDPELGGTAIDVARAISGLDRGRSVTVGFTWDTSGEEGNHSLYAIVDFANAVSEVTEDDNVVIRDVEVLPPLPNLVITALASEPLSPIDGSSAELTARVANVGTAASAATTVRLHREVPRLGIVLDEVSIGPISPGSDTDVVLSWDLASPIGSHSLHAVVDPDGAVRERFENDNQRFLSIDVRPPPPVQPDLEISIFTLTPSTLDSLPQHVAAAVRIANTGLDPVPEATVALFQGDPDQGGVLLQSRHPVFAPGDSAVDVDFVIDVTNGGTRTYFVRVDPGGVVERDPSNNEAFAVLRDLMDTVEVTLVPGSIVKSAETLDPGDVLSVDVTARNAGTRPLSSVAVTLFYEIATGGDFRRASVANVALPAGTEAVVTLTWRANRSGGVPLELRVDPENLLAETNEADNVLRFDVHVTPSTLPNLTLASSDIASVPSEPLEGQSATLDALVRNLGDGDAGPFEVRFYAGHPDGGNLIGSVPVASLLAQSQLLVSVVWDPILGARGDTLVYVSVDAGSSVEELDETDNLVFRVLDIRGLADVVATSAQVRLTPPFARSGENVTIEAGLTNVGEQVATAMAVELRLDDPLAGPLLAAEEIAELAPGDTASFETLWDTTGIEGEHALYLVLDVRNDVTEQREDNNVVRVPVALQDADVFVSPLYFSPNGDAVQDEAAFFYRSSATGTLRVEVRDLEDTLVRVLATDAPPNASYVWDGRNDRGVVAFDGGYSFVLLEDGVELLRRLVVLDTNRSRIVEALGTGFFSFNQLTCPMPGAVEGPAWLPNDSAAFVIVRATDDDAPDYPVGLYRVASDGRSIELIAEDDAFRELEFVETDFWSGSQRKPALSFEGDRALVRSNSEGLQVLSVVDGTRRSLGQDASARAMWTSDGRRILVASSSGVHFYDRDGALIKTVVTAEVETAVLTPDELRIVYRRTDEIALRLVNVDGSGDRPLEFTNASPLFEEEVSPFDLVVSQMIALESEQSIVFGWFINSAEQDAGPFRIDFDSEALEAHDFVSELSSDERWEIGFSNVYVARRFRGREERDIFPSSLGSDPHWSYRDTHFSYRAPGGDGCVSGGIWALRSLLNGEADFVLTKLASKFGVRIAGTVADQNLDFYRLEFASVATPDAFTPIQPPSSVPVIEDVIVTWIPPAAGDYLVRMTVRDRAGNETVRLDRILWNETLPIASLRREPTYLSPNGDGRQDELLVRYDVLAPANLVFHIRDERGASVRAIERNESVLGPTSFTWDGTDALGRPVGDGRYVLELSGAEFPVVVDTTPPLVQAAHSALYTDDTVPGVPRLAVDRKGRVLDANLDRWEIVAPSHEILESSSRQIGSVDELTPAFIRERARPVQNLELRAFDRAGNQSVVPVNGPSREVRVVSAKGKAVGPFEPGPASAVPAQSIKPDGSLSLKAQTSFEGHIRFFYREIGSEAQNEAPVEAGRPRLAARDLTLGAAYVGYFESDSLRSHEIDFTAGEGSIILTVVQGNFGLSVFMTNTVVEPLVAGRLVRTRGGSSEAVRVYGPVPYRDAFEDANPLCGTFALYRLEATGASGAVYHSTTEQAYPLPSVARAVGSPCFGVDDVGIEAQENPDTELPAIASAFIDSEAFVDPPAELILLLDGNEVARTPGGVGDVRAAFSVNDVAEGSHTLSVKALFANDTLVDGDSSLFFTLDQSPPEISIVSPSEGAAVCVGTDGGREFIVLDLSIRDRLVDMLAVELLQNGIWQRLPLLDSLPRPLGSVVERSLRVSIPSGLTGGQALRLLAWSSRIVDERTQQPTGHPHLPNRGNNGLLAAQAVRAVTLPPPLDLGSLTTLPARPGLFSPNGDLVFDELRVYGELSEAARLTARAYTIGPAPVLVRTIFVNDAQPSGPFEIVWDGRNDSGDFVPDAPYRIEVEATNGCGAVATAEVFVETDTTPPAVGIENLVANQPIAIGVEVVGTADDVHFDHYVLDYGIGPAPPSFIEIAPPVRSRIRSRILGNWSVGDLDPGPHTLRLSASDTVGNKDSVELVVDVVNSDFIARHRAEPALFSPNGDTVLDTTELQYELEAEARVTLQIRDGGDAVVTEILTGELRTAGAHPELWDGRGLSGLLPDGEYAVFLRAEHPGVPTLFEESRVVVTIDTTPPDITITAPAPDSFVKVPTSITGSIGDQNLEQYVVSVGPVGGALVPVASDSLPVNGTIAVLRSFDDGSYRLSATASDRAGNTTELELPFGIDSRPPVLSLTSPADGSFLTNVPPSVPVTGAVSDANLARYDLELGFGSSPSVFVPLAGQTTAPESETLASLDLEGLPDGSYTLRLSARDLASNVSFVESKVTLDKTPPSVAIEKPAPGSILSGAFEVRGTSTDPNFGEGSLAIAPLSRPEQLTVIAHFPAPVVSAVLFDGLSLVDGDYLIELSTVDRSGNVAKATTNVTVDNEPPLPPADLVATGELRDVHLSWSPSPSTDAVGYHVSRDGGRITTAPVSGTTFLDPSLSDGRYVYTVVAVDRGGLESDPSEPATASVDTTPPTVVLRAPASGERVRVQVDVVGTAYSESDFFEYRLSVAPASNPLSPTLLKRSGVPVSFDTLYSWRALVDGDFLITLEAEDTSGNTASDRVRITVDNEPPGAPVLVRAEASAEPDDVELEWTPPADADVAGFLVYRNGKLANAPGNVGSNLKPFLVPGPAYADADLPDGNHCYRVVAMDVAGNSSAESNERCVFLDNRVPKAVIFDPESGARFDAPRIIRAGSEDLDIARVDFEYQKVGEGFWNAIGTDTDLPYEALWDVNGLDFGDYLLRAVATDIGTKPDPSPDSIDVVLGDATAPATPRNLVARVTGDTVDLTWEALTDSDLGGYRIYRDDAMVLEPGPAAVAAADVAVPDGLYSYSVSSLDADGNESERSAPATAHV